MTITVYDFILLILVGLGMLEGRKKGFYQMLAPFISFIVALFLMKWVSMFIMNIFGGGFIAFFYDQLDYVVAQMPVSGDIIEDIKYQFVQKFVQGIVFLISYIAINITVTYLFNKIKKISNNMVIYRIDQILGCVFGAFANLFTVILVLTVLQVIYDMNVVEIVEIVNSMKKSIVIEWLIENNYIYKYFSIL